jgi:hypothetical protein
VADVDVKATTALKGWKVTVTLPSGTSIASLWNGVISGSTGAVTVANAGYNGAIAAGGSSSFGFIGNGSSSGITLTCSAA